jgi:hydroxymethylglutaryl-CoA lyase
VAEGLIALGCREVSLGDTIGRGTPDRVVAMLGAVLGVAPAARLAGHFHDTSGRALENIEAALGLGLRVFDAACGGLGGCPFAPGATGNVASEAVVARVEALGFATGIDAEKLGKAGAFARGLRVES